MANITATETNQSLYRVLIVDDEMAICELLAEVLKSPNRSIEVRDTARGAVEFLQQNPVDLAFVDVTLPGMSGLELAGKIKQSNPQSRIVICTGFYGEEIATQAQAAQADRILHKPLDFGEVVQVADSYTPEI